ncbi:MAG: AMP-binding protein, partial [Nitriliruptorales bacterium]|nr:AMP-binding protein [Nitriliruptorales bacterium]
MSSYDERPWLRRYPDGIGPTLARRHDTMVSVWDAAVAARADEACMHAFDTTLTFRDVDDAADALAAALQDGGLRRGDRVGIYLQNDPQWPIVLIATWKAGGIAVALNPMLKARELAYHLKDSGATVLVCLEALYDEVVRDVLPRVDVARVITTHPADWLDGPMPALVRDQVGEKAESQATEDLRGLVERYAGQSHQRVEVAAPDVAILTYTSGTTGPPKGAMNTHDNMSHNAQLLAEWFTL